LVFFIFNFLPFKASDLGMSHVMLEPLSSSQHNVKQRFLIFRCSVTQVILKLVLGWRVEELGKKETRTDAYLVKDNIFRFAHHFVDVIEKLFE
jgi:hypothetical protein